ncbi:MAG: hypothetical protein O2794_00670, partial [bacterium]|nr:hypothetical protein [bacterium]
RYSTFSPVGLFPLMCAGIDVKKMLEGAARMRERCLTYTNDNPALISAVILFLYNQKNIRINNNFYFNTELESLGKWYRQLMGESLGKGVNNNGDLIHAGITPTVALGSLDLHAMAQLYLSGPHDKLTTFLYAENNKEGLKVPKRLMFPGLVEGIAGRDMTHIMDAIYGGAIAAYKKNNLPFMEIIFDEIHEDSIGQYLQMKMMEMMYLAKLLGINAFDQPNVEDYKAETRKLLGA